MRLATVGWVLSLVWLGLSAVLAVPWLLAVWQDEPALPFALAVGTASGSGAALLFWLRNSPRDLGHREAFLTVTLVWCSVCALGAIPFVTYPGLQLGIVDGLFESTSGFTTTGSTLLSSLDTLPSSLLLWRSMTQWLGGMGMVLFGVAVLPLLGVGGMQLYKAEAPGPTKDKMTPRIAETAKILWALYLGLTVAAALLFYLNDMSGLDALNHAMTAISTGGFSTHDSSIGYFDSASIRFITIVTMLAGGTSFPILHGLLTRGVSWKKQPELRAYVGIFLFATLVMSADLLLQMPERFSGSGDALSHAAFQAASIMTTTGYATQDFDLWPTTSHAVLFALFFVGGMAGSTAGGPKVVRVLLLVRVAWLQLATATHRHGVHMVRLGEHTVEDRVILSSLGFLSMWIILLGLGSLALAAGGLDPLSSLSAAAVSLGNIGPGFGAVGPSHTFAELGTGSKLVVEALMILGRLEIYTVLIVLTPGFWRF